MATEDWCRCWRTKREFDVMADDRGVCKHCTKKIAFFFIPRKGAQR
jgi:hypothetical protein